MEAYSDFLVAIDAWESEATLDWARVVFEQPTETDEYRRVIVEAGLQFAVAAYRVYLMGPNIVRKAGSESHVIALGRAVSFEYVENSSGLSALLSEDDSARERSKSAPCPDESSDWNRAAWPLSGAVPGR